MFVDETGVSDYSTSHPFTVTGVIFEYKYAFNTSPEQPRPLKIKIDEFKEECFNKKDFTFHLKNISSNEAPFTKEDGVSIAQLRNFWIELPTFLSKLDCTIISVTVNKEKLLQYYKTPKDPYVIAFSHIMKSFYSFLIDGEDEKTETTARIVMESRDDYQNLLVQKSFFDIFNSGTIHIDFSTIKEKLKGFIFASKDDLKYHSGLEIADLLCNPLSRARQGIIEANPENVEYGSENRILEAIKDKLYVKESSQSFRNWGFKLVPITKKTRDWETNPNKIKF